MTTPTVLVITPGCSDIFQTYPNPSSCQIPITFLNSAAETFYTAEIVMIGAFDCINWEGILDALIRREKLDMSWVWFLYALFKIETWIKWDSVFATRVNKGPVRGKARRTVLPTSFYVMPRWAGYWSLPTNLCGLRRGIQLHGETFHLRDWWLTFRTQMSEFSCWKFLQKIWRFRNECSASKSCLLEMNQKKLVRRPNFSFSGW